MPSGVPLNVGMEDAILSWIFLYGISKESEMINELSSEVLRTSTHPQSSATEMHWGIEVDRVLSDREDLVDSEIMSHTP